MHIAIVVPHKHTALAVAADKHIVAAADRRIAGVGADCIVVVLVVAVDRHIAAVVADRHTAVVPVVTVAHTVAVPAVVFVLVLC
ncbi:hypothetical protein R83H12_01176 [Fibrobacteria bacterium R8-3-H12]